MKLLILPITVLSVVGLGLSSVGASILIECKGNAPDAAVGMVVLGLITIAAACAFAYHCDRR